MINENGLLNIFPTAEASGSIVSFENGADGIPMESISVAVEHIQDLHGYENPWPGGGGKNLLPLIDGTYSIGSTGATAVVADGSITITGTTTAGGGRTNRLSSYFTLKAGTYIVSPIQNTTPYVRGYINKKSDGTALGYSNGNAITVAEDTEVYYGIGIESGKTYDVTIKPQVEAGSTITTWVPYSNICPISGRTGLSVYRTGKNYIANATIEQGSFNMNNGNDLASNTRVRTNGKWDVPSGSYKIGCDQGYEYICYVYGTDGTFIDAESVKSWTNTETPMTIVGSRKIRCGWRKPDNSTIVPSEISHPFVCVASDTATYSFDWSTQAGTVYHGTVDPVTGQLTVTHGFIILVGGNEATYSNNGHTNFSTRCLVTISGKANGVNNMTSNQFAYSSTDDYIGIMLGRAANNKVEFYIPPSVSTNVADQKAWFSDNPTEVCYELATPITYQLTPQEVATLLGSNRVWSDAGDISLVYHAQADTTPSSIDGLFINGERLQADGWFLKWRKLAAPKPKTDYVSVWGRDGDIDLTESETDGQVFYENRELTMDMVYMGEDWTDAYSELLDMLHGKECAVQFSNDPYWYWAGRIIASLYEHKPHSLTMSGIMFPYKLSVAKVTRSATVSGAIESNGVDVVLPSSRMRVSPKVTVVAGTGESVTLKWGSKTQTLSAGTYYVRGLKVGSDDVTIKVWGTGTVTFEYRKGML